MLTTYATTPSIFLQQHVFSSEPLTAHGSCMHVKPCEKCAS